MAKSAAKKMREKRIREGKMDLAAMRSPFALADLRTRRTKTKQEVLGRVKHKKPYENPNFTGGEQGSFYFVRISRKGVDEKKPAC
ncbi:hypothetical protein [Saccharibacillus qingshengii]|uniref:hypothetical protein n=1 Tax=Saccharibacillus qingshengii TaxID=1763540 RepID=UPI0015520E27|nr:hypothetical protein [Saccharibacillus qingshengii]